LEWPAQRSGRLRRSHLALIQKDDGHEEEAIIATSTVTKAKLAPSNLAPKRKTKSQATWRKTKIETNKKGRRQSGCLEREHILACDCCDSISATPPTDRQACSQYCS
jgi:hypothetical protein